MNVLIVMPTLPAPSETFLRAHVNGVEGEVQVLTGCYPRYALDGRTLQDTVFPDRDKRAWRWTWMPHFAAFRIIKRRRQRTSDEQALNLFLARKRPHVILAEYGTTGADLAPLCAALQIPLVTHFHGFDAYRTSTLTEYAARYRFMFAHAAGVIAVSQHMVEKLVRLGLPRDRLVCSPCGSRGEFFGLRIEPGSNQVLSVGRFVDKKAPCLTLAAFAEVALRHPQLRLTMVGEGPLLNSCRSMARALQVADRVCFPGALSHDQVMKEMQRSFCYMQHSVTAEDGDSEGTPVAVIEAGAASLPVISTRHGGIEDVVVDGETGFLVDECDVRGMARHLEAVHLDREMAARVGRAARQRVREQFGLERHLASVNAVLRRASGVA